MLPNFYPGQKVLVQKKWFFCKVKKGDVVVLKDKRHKLIILKRIKDENKNSYFVVGDNKNESRDSRVFGWVEKKQVIGKVIYSNRP